MKSNFDQLKPEGLWRHFRDILSIPHPSGCEAALMDHIERHAANIGVETRRDEVGNLILSKGATEGMESCRGVILQAHVDMVPQCSSEREFDFERDPIEAYVDRGWVRAHGTTLGADNGIGVAAALAILEDERAVHGDLEVLLTVNEEAGLDGAFGLQPDVLRGDILLNLDTEVEGELCIGCAGGLSLTATFDHEMEAPMENSVAYRLTVEGLRGGHSGIQIGEQRGNAIKLLARFLRQTKLDMQIAQISGGTLSNAIPREAFADILINIEDQQRFHEQVERYEALLRMEYATIDGGVSLSLTPIERASQLIESSAASCIVWSLAALHNGVYRNSYTMQNLVETSSNLAIVQSGMEQTTVSILLRSFTEAGKIELADTIASTFELADAEVICTDGYPGWRPNANSDTLRLTASIYQDLFGTEPEVKAIHAGLECGVIGATYPHLDMISFGPNIVSPHSPEEAVEIDSVERFYTLLLTILKNTPKRD